MATQSALLAIVAATACAGGPTSDTGAATATSTSEASTTSTTASTDGMSSTSVGSTTTTTSAGETRSSSVDSTTGDCSSLCGLDVGGTSECDLWTQDCPEGQKCNAWANDGGGAWNAAKCVPVDPDPDKVHELCTVEGSALSGIDSCEKGAMCWNVDPETNTGVCVALCQGDAAQCNRDPGSCCEEGSCYVSGSGTLILCLQTCDPILQDCWGGVDVCYPVGEGFKCAPDVSGDMGSIGDPCEFINVCDPGTYCGDPSTYPGCDPNAAGCCMPFCSLKAPACPMGTECMPWYDPMDVPPGYEDLGACVIP